MNPQKPRKAPKPLGIAIVLISGALTGYWAWTYTSLYRWLAELQLRFMHEYEMQLTFIGTLILVIVPLYFVSEIIRRLIVATHPAQVPIDDAAPKPARTNPLLIAWLKGGIISIVGLGFVVVGAYQYHQAQTAGSIVHVDVSDFENNKPPAAPYISVTGFSLRNAAAGVKSSDSVTKYYIPLISPDWDPSKPVGLFLETDTPNMMESNAIDRKMPGNDKLPEIWEGMIDTTGLPGLVRTQFENAHALFAPNYRVLDVGQTPQSQMSNAKAMMIIGASVAALGLIVSLFSALKTRRAIQQPQPLIQKNK